MVSITGKSRGTGHDTFKAANGVNTGGSNAATTVVCCTLVDIYVP